MNVLMCGVLLYYLWVEVSKITLKEPGTTEKKVRSGEAVFIQFIGG